MLNIKELQKEVHLRETKYNNTFQEILKIVHKKILNTNQKNNDCYCYYQIPAIIYGLPRFNIHNCLIFLSNELSKNGFRVQTYFPNTLYISWKPEDNPYHRPAIGYYDTNKYPSYNSYLNVESNTKSNKSSSNSKYDLEKNFSTYSLNYHNFPTSNDTNNKLNLSDESLLLGIANPQNLRHVEFKEKKNKLPPNTKDITTYQPDNEIIYNSESLWQ